MLFRLLLLFIAIPFLELVLLLKLADTTSWWFTLLVVVITGVVGATLARWQGWRVWRMIQHEFQAGRIPADALLDGLLIFIAGGLLLTPGLITDLLGICLLIPPTRRLVREMLKRNFGPHVVIHQSSSFSRGGSWTGDQQLPPRGDRVIDSYVISREDEPTAN